MKKNANFFLLVGAAILVFVIIIIATFPIFNIANVVSGH